MKERPSTLRSSGTVPRSGAAGNVSAVSIIGDDVTVEAGTRLAAARLPGTAPIAG